MNPHPTLRLTPTKSPFHKSPSIRSPTKLQRGGEEPGLQLRKVIGTTTATANGFDCLPGAHSFAYTAGAAAVFAQVDEDLKLTQRFFRARPSAVSSSKDANQGRQASPTLGESRHRNLAYTREQGTGGSLLASAGRDWSDSPTGRSTTAKDRVKAATSVAISPNGKWLAVGETGYKPRVLVFSLLEGSSETPVTVISEHTFGVHALRFSPDSRFLASLGTVNDGFLYIWSLDDRSGAARLHASNKLTTLVNSMAWMDNSLVTAGLRFIKVWRPDEELSNEAKNPDPLQPVLSPRYKSDLRTSDFGNSILSPKHKALSGKNSLLGELLECNFIAILPLTDLLTIICAQSGEVCLLDDTNRAQSLTLVCTVEFRITAARLVPGRNISVLGACGRVKHIDLAELEPQSKKLATGRRRSILKSKPMPANSHAIVATAAFEGAVVDIDSERTITIDALTSSSQESLLSPQSLNIPAHKDAVLGVRAYNSEALPAARLLTFSGDGTLHFWDGEGDLVTSMSVPVAPSPDPEAQPNELKSFAVSSNGTKLATGDKFGVLSVLDIPSGSVVTTLRAHSAEILDAASATFDGVQLLATAGRDRMVQLFSWQADRLNLLQTMDEHAGAVTGVLFDIAGRRLLTHSSDRSIVVREAFLRYPDDPASITFMMLRVIAVKSSPTSMCLAEEDQLLISAVDRCVSKYNLRNGRCTFTFKCTDLDGGEAAVVSKLAYAPSLNGNPTIAAISSSDKSVRLYSDYGSLIARDWGHTEGITDIALVDNANRDEQQPATTRLVTVAADCTIFVWDTTMSTGRKQSDDAQTNCIGDARSSMQEMATGPPMRRVISHSEMARLRRDKSGDDSDQALQSPSMSSSPRRLLKSSSRMSLAQTPRLEPAFRSSVADVRASPKTSLRQRSPSPSSPRPVAKSTESPRRQSMAPLRSKSSDTVVKEAAPASNDTKSAEGSASTFGSLASSTSSVCRTLRTYRRRLARESVGRPPTDVVDELEKELKLTLRALTKRSRGSSLDDSAINRLLEQVDEDTYETPNGRTEERQVEAIDTVAGAVKGMSLDSTVL